MPLLVELIVVLTAALGATVWYVGQQAFIDRQAHSHAGGDGDCEGDRLAFAIVAPALAGLVMAASMGLGFLPEQLRDFELGTFDGGLVVVLAGMVIGLYYRIIGQTAQARGKGVFAVCYYVPLIVSTTLAGMWMRDLRPPPLAWAGIALGIPSIIVIRWPGAEPVAAPPAHAVSAARWTALVAGSVAGSLVWTALQRFVLGNRAASRVSPGAFVVCSAFAAAATVALLSAGRPGVAARLRSAFRVPAARKLLLAGGAALGVMYAALAVGLVHDLTRLMWIYYTLMIVLLALAGRFVLRRPEDELRLHQWIAIGVAAASTVLISCGRR